MQSTFYQRTLGLFRQFGKKAQTAPILGLSQKDTFVLGTCCHPVVGEAIVGIKNKHHYYTIHRRDCATLSKYKKYPEKWVAVEWNLSPNNHYPQPARLKIIWKTGPTTMGNVLDILIRQKAQVVHMNTLAQTDKTTEIVTDIQVKDLEHLERVIRLLRAHSKIVSIQKENGK